MQSACSALRPAQAIPLRPLRKHGRHGGPTVDCLCGRCRRVGKPRPRSPGGLFQTYAWGARDHNQTVGTRSDHELRVDAPMEFVLRDATGLPISIAEDPLSCVVMGTGRCLEELKTLRHVLIGA